jgi:hypothetical protein
MGFTTDEEMVRVDFFREGGKWYTTEAIKFDRYHSTLEGTFESPNETLKRCLREQLGDRLSDMVAVCLEPYSKNAYPLMVKDW